MASRKNESVFLTNYSSYYTFKSFNLVIEGIDAQKLVFYKVKMLLFLVGLFQIEMKL